MNKQKSRPPLLHGQQLLTFARTAAKREQSEEQPQEQQQQPQVLEYVQGQQDMKERRKQQSICESCFEEDHLSSLRQMAALKFAEIAR